MGKFFILNADDFGMTKEHNKAVLEGYNNGFLTSVSLLANGEAFSAAVNDILPECPNIGVGVHLNISTGKSLTKCDLLTNQNGYFNGGFIYFWLKSEDKKFLKQLEQEFRAQIEKIKTYSGIDHISSKGNIHIIPGICKLISKLAKEYDIRFIRTLEEKIYFVPEIFKHINFHFPFNFIKILFLNNISKLNTTELIDARYKHYVLGLEYANLLTPETIELGLKSIDEENCIVECIIKPCFSDTVKNAHTTEFAITQDRRLEDTINRLGFEITNYKNIK